MLELGQAGGPAPCSDGDGQEGKAPAGANIGSRTQPEQGLPAASDDLRNADDAPHEDVAEGNEEESIDREGGAQKETGKEVQKEAKEDGVQRELPEASEEGGGMPTPITTDRELLMWKEKSRQTLKAEVDDAERFRKMVKGARNTAYYKSDNANLHWASRHLLRNLYTILYAVPPAIFGSGLFLVVKAVVSLLSDEPDSRLWMSVAVASFVAELAVVATKLVVNPDYLQRKPM